MAKSVKDKSTDTKEYIEMIEEAKDEKGKIAVTPEQRELWDMTLH